MAWYFYPLIYIGIIWLGFILGTKYWNAELQSHHPDQGITIAATIFWPVTILILTVMVIGVAVYKTTKVVANILPEPKKQERKVQNF